MWKVAVGHSVESVGICLSASLDCLLRGLGGRQPLLLAGSSQRGVILHCYLTTITLPCLEECDGFRFFFFSWEEREKLERVRKRERGESEGEKKKYCLYHKTLSEISGLVKRPWLEYEWWEKSRVVWVAWAEAGERISPTVPASLTAGKSNTVETPPLKLSDDKIREECSRISHRRRESRRSQLSVSSSVVIMALRKVSVRYFIKKEKVLWFSSETVK